MFVVGLLAFGSDRVIKDQLISNGYAWSVPLGALLLLGAVVLGQRQTRWRLLGFAGWGFAAGVALWTDWLIAPYLAAAAALLVLGVGRELWGRSGLALLAGLLVGDAAQIAYDVAAGWPSSSVNVYLHKTLGGAAGPETGPLADRLEGGLLIGVPMRLGLCEPNACGGPSRVFGVAVLVLLVVSGVLALLGVRRARRLDLVQAGRLALVLPALLSIALYTHSAAAGIAPTESVRYLVCVVISTPAFFWPLWTVARRLTERRIAAVVAIAVLAAFTVQAVVSTARVAGTVAWHRQAGVDQRALIGALEQLGVRYFYTQYWTCARLVFATRERLVCANVSDDLGRDQDKLPGHRAAVDAAAAPAYVFESGSAVDRAFADYLRGQPDGARILAAAHEVAGYRIYLPDRRLAVPH